MRPVILVIIGLALGSLFCPSHSAWAQAPAPSGTVLTIAGSGSFSFSGDAGLATDAGLNLLGRVIGPNGTLDVADISNYRIRAIDPVTGIITTVASSGTSARSAAAARPHYPTTRAPPATEPINAPERKTTS